MFDPHHLIKTIVPTHKCCIRNCKSHTEPHPEGRITFHPIPPSGHLVVIQTQPGKLGKIDRRAFWCRRLRLREPVCGTLRVCSLHFREQDFYFKSKKAWEVGLLFEVMLCFVCWLGVDKVSGIRRFLRRNAVPCRQLPSESAVVDEE